MEDLMPACELRVTDVGEMLADDPLQVGVDRDPVEHPAFVDDAAGQRDPTLGPLAGSRQHRLGRRSMPSAISRLKATQVGRRRPNSRP